MCPQIIRYTLCREHINHLVLCSSAQGRYVQSRGTREREIFHLILSFGRPCEFFQIKAKRRIGCGLHRLSDPQETDFSGHISTMTGSAKFV